jgi:hypothetical protein
MGVGDLGQAKFGHATFLSAPILARGRFGIMTNIYACPSGERRIRGNLRVRDSESYTCAVRHYAIAMLHHPVSA